MRNVNGDNFLFIDTETGGTDFNKHSLLSIGLVAWNTEIGIYDELEIFIKHKDYVVTKLATKINKFDPIKQNKIGINEKNAIKRIMEFVSSNFESSVYINFIGHNVFFDISFIKKMFLLQKVSFNKTFSHRAIDTNSVIKTLILADRLPRDINNLSSAFKYFQINIRKRHSALSDAIATVELYEKLIDVLKK